MKLMKNLFMLLTVLLAGSSLNNANNANKMVVAEAREAGSYAFVSTGWVAMINLKITDVAKETIKSVVLTNDVNKIPGNYLDGCPISITLKTNETVPEGFKDNHVVSAYVSRDTVSTNMFHCTLYADVDNFYACDCPNSTGLFSGLANAEKISFDFDNSNSKFIMSNTSLNCMFSGCKTLTSLDLSTFDTSNSTDMGSIFSGCTNLTSIKNLNSFNTSNATNMYGMFSGCSSLTSVDVSAFDTSKVENMRYMFEECSSLTSIDVSNFDTSNVTNMGGLFYKCSSLTAINGLKSETWNTSKVTDMSRMFSKCNSLEPLDVSGLETGSVTNMTAIFEDCFALTSIDGLDNFDTRNVTNMSFMFLNCNKLKSLNVSSFDTRNVTNMFGMFNGCGKLETIVGLDNEKWNTSKVTNMSGMFNNCYDLKSIDLSRFNTENVTNFSLMFNHCWDLKTLDLSTFSLNSIPNDESSASKMKQFISTASGLEEIKAPANLNGKTIALPEEFGMTEIESTMENTTLIKGSKELNMLYSTLKTLKTCEEYMKGPELQAIYDGLSIADKATFATLTDDSGVLLTDKLNYMVAFAASKTTPSATAGKNMVAAASITNQCSMAIIVIACLSLASIAGYYFVQKRKYAK